MPITLHILLTIVVVTLPLIAGLAVFKFFDRQSRDDDSGGPPPPPPDPPPLRPPPPNSFRGGPDRPPAPRDRSSAPTWTPRHIRV